MSRERAATLLICVVSTLVFPATSVPEAYQRSYETNYETNESHSSNFGGPVASKNQPVVQTKTTFKGCSSETGCGGVTLENGQVVHKYGNPAAIGLDGQPENFDPAELHKKFALQASDINSAFSGNIPANGPFWWANQDSPFKNAHETYMKWLKEGIAGTHFPSPCSACAAAAAAGNSIGADKKVSVEGTFSNNIDIASNPFLNGQFSSGSLGGAEFSKGTSGFSSQGASSVDISKNPFLNGNIHIASTPGQQSSFQSSYHSTSTTGTGGSGLNIAANPFLNGAVSGGCGAGGCGQSSGSVQHSGSVHHSGSVSGGSLSTGGISGGSSGSLSAGCAGKPGGCGQSTGSTYQGGSVYQSGSTSGGSLSSGSLSGGSSGSSVSGGCAGRPGGCGQPSGPTYQSGSVYQSSSTSGGSLSSGSLSGGSSGSSVSGGCAGRPGGCGQPSGPAYQSGSVYQSGSTSGGSLSSGSLSGGSTGSSVSGGCAGRPGGCGQPSGPAYQSGSVYQSGSTSGGSLSSDSLSGGSTGSSVSGGCAGRPGGCGGANQGTSFTSTGSFQQQTSSKPFGGSSVNSIQTTGSGCDASSGGCSYQGQSQVTTGFGQTSSGCTGPFCGNQQQTQQPFPGKPPGSGSTLPHPPGATAGGFRGETTGTGELTISCSGQGYICVQKRLCNNGYVNDNGENILQVRGGVRCNTASEVCCKLKPKAGAAVVGGFQSSNGNKLDSATLQSSISSTITGPGLIKVPGTSSGANFASQSTTGFGQGQTNFGQTSFGQTGFAQTTGVGQTGFNSGRPANDVVPPYNSQQSNVYKGTSFSQTQEQAYRPGASVAKPGIPYLPPDEPTTKPPPPRVTTTRTTYYQPPPSPKTTPYQPPYQPTTKPTPYRPPPTQKTTPYRPPVVTTGPPYLPPREDESPQPSSGSLQLVIPPHSSGAVLLDNTRLPPPNPQVPTIPNACAAALKCTSIEFCTADGIISNTSVVLTKQQAEFRVPLTDCKVLESGLVGKCCRDPTYTDPWPTNQLGQWVPGAFGDDGQYKANTNRQIPQQPQGFNRNSGPRAAGSVDNPVYVTNSAVRPNPNTRRTSQTENIGLVAVAPQAQTNIKTKPVTFDSSTNTNQGNQNLNIAPNKPPRYPVGQKNPTNRPPPIPNTNYPSIPNAQGNINIEDNKYSTGQITLSNYNTAGGQCGVRRQGIKPNGNRNKFEVDFAEIPWQAMVLLQTNRSLLCGGVITSPDVVVTSAHCVDGLEAKNVLIKGGEWKLGIDEEPKPFQIVQVSKIIRHPGYQPANLQNDLAILMLAEKLRFAQNIEPICIRPNGQTDQVLYSGKTQCIVTGWGKQVLQVNIPNSIMHSLDMNLVEPGQCQAQITQNYPHLLEQYNPSTCICGQPNNPIASVCKVDIGSALACTNGNGVYYMEGVYSWDSGCESSNQIASFYKFDASWYESAIGQSSQQVQQFAYNQNYNSNVQQQGNGNGNFEQRVNGGYTQNGGNYQEQSSQNSYQIQSNVQHTAPGQSFAVSGHNGFQQAIGGHVHTGTQCPCVKGKK